MASGFPDDATLAGTARDWLLRLSLEQPSEDDVAACAAWRAANPRHDAAFRRVEAIWSDAAELGSLVSVPPQRPNGFARLRRRLAQGVPAPVLGYAAAAGMAGALAVTVVALNPRLAPTVVERYATATSEMRVVNLSDGSRITLGARSILDVRMSSRERMVTLSAGEAFFDVGHDARRPFVLRVGDKFVHDVGTRFDARLGGKIVEVGVEAGAIEINDQPRKSSLFAMLSPTTPGDRGRIVVAGQSVVAHLNGQIEAPRPTALSEAGSWRQGRLVYIDTPLSEIITDANRYYPAKISVDDPNIGNTLLSVSFKVGQIDEMLNGLSNVVGVAVIRRKNGDVLISKAEP